ncbi:MAG: chitinase [Phenylobacterium sp.]|jgi:chitinase
MKKRMNKSMLTKALLLTNIMASGAAYAVNCDSLDVWNANVAYHGGAQVQLNDVSYSANWWSQSGNPETHSGPFQEWTNIGSCDGATIEPQVSLTSPLDGSSFSANDNVVISANASVLDGSIAHVAFTVDGAPVGTDSSSPYSLNWTAALGTHVISATATDNTGATAVTTVTITVADVSENVPPTSTLTSPTASSQITTGDNVTLTADASDSDGTVSSVDFYVDDVKVDTDATAPYEASWTATDGVHSFKATATDNNNAKSTSAVVSVSVSDGQVGGGCVGLPTYVAGTAYGQDVEVENNNHKYRCDVPGWCSSESAWAYEPGAGSAADDAWTDLGICAIAPDLNITSPSDNAVVLAGSSLTFAADASDSDGSVTQVEFFAAGSSLAVDTTAPYSSAWTPGGLGDVQLKAVATDNEGNATQSTVLVNVTDETIVANLSAPVSGTTVTLGKAVAIAASSSTFSGSIDKVEFMVNGAVVATDTTSPYSASWTPGSTGQYAVSAKATNSAGDMATSSAASVNVVNAPVGETHKLIGYWHNFINGSGCPMKLSDISSQWDVVDIAFADNDRNSNGTLHFNLFAGKEGCPAIDPAQFKLDIAALKAQGKHVVLSLGGAEGNITLNTAADEANFISSLSDIVSEWGFSGLDIDLESGSNLLHGTQIQARLPRALKTIETNMGGDMYLTMAPEHPYVQGGMIAYTGIWGAYIPLIDELRDTLDLLHVQLYNNGGLASPYQPNVTAEGSVDMMVASVKMLVEGFELADGSTFQPLRDDQVAIGLPSGPSSANSGQAPTQNIIDALDCISIGSSCGSIVPSKAFPNIGGVMTWSINWDEHDGFNFSGPIGAKIDAMNAR